MGREARINQAKRKREAIAYLESDEGKAELAEHERKEKEHHASKLADHYLNLAHQRVYMATLAAEVTRWAKVPLDELLTLTEAMHGRALALVDQDGSPMRRVALEIRETHRIVSEQLEQAAKREAAAQADGKVKSGIEGATPAMLTEANGVVRRACVLALANVFARVTVCELEVKAWAADDGAKGNVVELFPKVEGGDGA